MAILLILHRSSRYESAMYTINVLHRSSRYESAMPGTDCSIIMYCATYYGRKVMFVLVAIGLCANMQFRGCYAMAGTIELYIRKMVYAHKTQTQFLNATEIH